MPCIAILTLEIAYSMTGYKISFELKDLTHEGLVMFTT